MNKKEILNKFKCFWAGSKKNAEDCYKMTEKVKETKFKVGDLIKANFEEHPEVLRVVDIDYRYERYVLEGREGTSTLIFGGEDSYDICNTDETYEPLRRNRFLFWFADDFEVEQWWVKSYQLNDYFLTGDDKPKKQIKIEIIQAAFGKYEGQMSGFGDGKVVEIWKSFNEKGYPCIAIDDLDYKGLVSARQFFTLPVATNISFCKNAYSDDEIKSYEVTIQYDEIVEGSAYEKMYKIYGHSSERARDLINRWNPLYNNGNLRK